jgi:lipopolysaccharide/colanic/teichoic acid biosynthesis glycosyltransferase
MNQLHTRQPPKSMYSMSTPRRVLAITDVAAVALAWVVVLVGPWLADPDAHRASPLSIWLLVAIGVTATVLYREDLYLTRVLAIRAVEVQRLGRTCLIAAMLLIIIDWLVGAPLGWLLVGIGSMISYALLVVSRTAFQPWAHQARRGWDHRRSLLVVGDADDARRTLDLLRDRPELGYRVIGYVSRERASASDPAGGDPRQWARASKPAGASEPVDIGVPWLGTPEDLALVTQLTATTGVLIVGDALESEVPPATVSELRALDVHVHMIVDDAGHHPSIRILPLRHRSAPAVDKPALSSWQRVFKRAFDVVAGGLLAVVAAPVVLVAAGLLKLSAGGPVLVRDVRLGPGHEPLNVRRLRTNHLPPRRLARWVGRICRQLCIDELPQLTNVLAGSMSLVGPRPYRAGPAGQHNAGQHNAAPTGVNAGLIGLRHVEARDYPEHGPHRRLDHFYAENWSIGLDLSIVAASATHVLWRSTRQAIRGDEHVAVG